MRVNTSHFLSNGCSATKALPGLGTDPEICIRTKSLYSLGQLEQKGDKYRGRSPWRERVSKLALKGHVFLEDYQLQARSTGTRSRNPGTWHYVMAVKLYSNGLSQQIY